MATAFLTSTNQAANSVIDLMQDADQGTSNLRFIQRASKVVYAIDGVNVGDEYEIFSGGRNVIQRSRLSGGATAGVQPRLDSAAIAFFAAGGEILEVRVRELGGVATQDVNLIIDVTPLG